MYLADSLLEGFIRQDVILRNIESCHESIIEPLLTMWTGISVR